MRSVRRIFTDKTGATVIEYGLIAALMSAAIISGVGAFGGSLSNTFNLLSDTIQNSAASQN
ncbi:MULTISPECIES: Flp family type IVb pilin [Rhizobium]|jgi:pilus assembly protein Flp/PilA|uniref:Flp family type IVb pilin n=2 Tax=Rhizobium TaxID=379 RepID=A0A6P1C973_RHITR|nr:MULTISPECIES: Flp family type IVb pilin [Rhizobium]AGB72604.1 component of type IV pilus, pilin subunit protein [Rhizobium tropici CIAT 899]MBB3385729.1 pilus assembly protein Flp/PilA [Rhizobium sp. BK098]MBB3570345.1 pilus assembly protein Flp/PilA [Rhizobium sp. BK491]MBB3617434.1 pilus assembly protein Flp/PilA [Rhizobium sp. BK609]MBB3683303.1 pilus assembly protein Flp/PilA [Rhizobium sp. BK612]